MKHANRRQHKRLRIDSTVRVPIQVFPVLPFLGESISAVLQTLSVGGLSLIIDKQDTPHRFKKGSKIKIHFRLSGEPLRECLAKIQSHNENDDDKIQLGLKFVDLPKAMHHLIEQMTKDNDVCERRIHELANPSCYLQCAFYAYCRKPIRLASMSANMNQMEFSLQAAE